MPLTLSVIATECLGDTLVKLKLDDFFYHPLVNDADSEDEDADEFEFVLVAIDENGGLTKDQVAQLEASLADDNNAYVTLTVTDGLVGEPVNRIVEVTGTFEIVRVVVDDGETEDDADEIETTDGDED